MTELNASYSLAPFTVRDGAMWTMPEEAVPNRVVTAIKSAGRRVQHARLSTGPLFTNGEPLAQLNRLIALLPECETLELQYDTSIDIFAQYTSTNLEAWMKAIGNLKKLTRLSTNGFEKWDATLCFMGIALPPKLSDFAAQRCSVSVFAIEALGKECGATLVSLSLADLEWPLRLQWQECEGPFHFPALRRLVLWTEVAAGFMDAFKLAPLEHVVLARESHVEGFSFTFDFQGRQHCEHDVEGIDRLCAQHTATLRTVRIHQDHLTSGHEQLEPYLGNHGLAGALFSGATPAFPDDV
ncbi:hypothetical protein BMF94_2665 [Rhodotorula taiwanensis]|uniref:Uncharacterized protein n=1 Tax=Rhodotorula taiwanensis TaxID=741276 RepID=A0A2S5BBT7_9BASI|nr:hypothetical protein BMF94_2665 [Rhodotorula taiwanensis]